MAIPLFDEHDAHPARDPADREVRPSAGFRTDGAGGVRESALMRHAFTVVAFLCVALFIYSGNYPAATWAWVAALQELDLVRSRRALDDIHGVLSALAKGAR